MSGSHLICANITLEMILHRQKQNQKRQKFPRFDKAFESSVRAHWPLISRLELWKQGGPTTMRLAHVGAVVSGMMRVVVNQSHFLEEEEKTKTYTISTEQAFRCEYNRDVKKHFDIQRPAFFPLTRLHLFSPALISNSPRLSHWKEEIVPLL